MSVNVSKARFRPGMTRSICSWLAVFLATVMIASCSDSTPRPLSDWKNKTVTSLTFDFDGGQVLLTSEPTLSTVLAVLGEAQYVEPWEVPNALGGWFSLRDGDGYREEAVVLHTDGYGVIYDGFLYGSPELDELILDLMMQCVSGRDGTE